MYCFKIAKDHRNKQSPFHKQKKGMVKVAYILLFSAIVTEIFGSTMLKLSRDVKKILPTIGFIGGLSVSFYLFSLSLLNLSLGFSSAISSGLRTIFTAVIGVILFQENLNINIL